MVLVSDGVTNEASDQEIVDIVKEWRTPEQGAKAVVSFVTETGRDGDNATCLVVRLGGWERRSEGGVGSMGTKEGREWRRSEAMDPRRRRTDVQDLIDQNDELARDCLQLSQDLDTEKNERRRLQNRIRDELEPLNFRDTFLNKNEEGGRKAADELLIQVQQYLKELVLDVHGTDVVVRAYANLRGLGKACVKHGTMRATADICLFANGFTRRQPLFDFVDVGLGKERADHKVRETFNFFVSQLQCRHVILGVCHDSSYVPFLERFAADESIRDRVTLLEGHQTGIGIRQLGFKRVVKFNSVFASTPGSNTHSTLEQSRTTMNAGQAAKGPYTFAAVDPRRLGPVLKNGDGLRMDKPLSAEPSLVKAMRQKSLCYWLYLRGHCEGCNRYHGSPPLSVNEQHALWFLARQGACYAHAKGKLCEDPKCVYGHAPWSDQGVKTHAVEDSSTQVA
ncbi:MAG: hypothetical protein Q9184_006968 [Pyrenodesmia sp. 2 TL-2023]